MHRKHNTDKHLKRDYTNSSLLPLIRVTRFIKRPRSRIGAGIKEVFRVNLTSQNHTRGPRENGKVWGGGHTADYRRLHVTSQTTIKQNLTQDTKRRA